jgi:hypothetical protein
MGQISSVVVGLLLAGPGMGFENIGSWEGQAFSKYRTFSEWLSVSIPPDGRSHRRERFTSRIIESCSMVK